MDDLLDRKHRRVPGFTGFDDAARAFDSALDNLAGALAKGEAVQLVGLGNFTASNRAERSCRNPSTSEPMTIKASKAVKFTAGKSLKDAVNAV